MTPVDALAAPIRSLLDAVGSGSVSATGTSSTLRGVSSTLDAADARLQHALDALVRDWQSTAGDAAFGAVREHRGRAAQASRDGSTVADVIDEAAQSIRRAATDLRAILDSFVSAADAIGPSLYSPVGLVTVVPVAADHLRRAIAVVERTRSELDSLARRMAGIGRGPLPDAGEAHRQITSALGQLARRFEATPAATQRSVPADGGARTRSASVDSAATADVGKPGGPPTPGAVPITLPDGSVAYAPNHRAATAVRAALSQRGVPYEWGGTSPGRGLDCSALTQYAYRQAGVELPRLAQDQDTAGYRVAMSELLPGDLAVWSGHVAMYVGNGQMVEAGDPVSVSPVRTTNLGQAFEGFYRPR